MIQGLGGSWLPQVALSLLMVLPESPTDDGQVCPRELSGPVCEALKMGQNNFRGSERGKVVLCIPMCLLNIELLICSDLLGPTQ